MAEIRPLRAWRYNRSLYSKIDELTAPLFDVVTEKQREKLYKIEFSSIHLSVPRSDNPAESARETLAYWKKNNIIVQDNIPGIYVYYQYFSLPGSVNEICRKGFLCNIRLYEWEDNVILRHESTKPSSILDRVENLEKTELNISPTFGLYTDESFSLEGFMDEAISHPIYETENYQGVKDVLAVIHDREVIKKFIATLSDKQVILADGHHRYESALIHKRNSHVKNPKDVNNQGYDFLLMYLTNSEADHVRILPTHRLIINVDDFDEQKTMDNLKIYFDIQEVSDAFNINEVIVGKKWAYGLIFKDSAYKIQLKPGLIESINWPFPEVISQLDLTVAHYFIIEKCLGIKGKEQQDSKNILYERNFSDCYAKVLKGEVQMAIIVNEIHIDEVKKVCYSGSTFPQKSTYFYPKVITGFLFNSIKNDEFKFPLNLRF